MSISWYNTKCSPRILLNAGMTETGRVKTMSIGVRNVRNNCWETSAKTNLSSLIEDIARSNIFIYSVYDIQCDVRYSGSY